MAGGRTTKLTPERQKRIVAAVSLGLARERAAILGGINELTLRRWLARGQREKTGIYCTFCTAIKEAEIEAEARAISQIQAAASGKSNRKVERKFDAEGNVISEKETFFGAQQWTAAAWLAERMSPQRWARPAVAVHNTIEATGDKVSVKVKSDAAVEDLLGLLADGDADGEEGEGGPQTPSR